MSSRVRTPGGATFNVPPVRGQLFVCEGCCCGDPEKGARPVPHDIFHAEWERRRLRSKVHLTFTACLGPCAVANVAYLQIDGRSLWLHSLDDDPKLVAMLFDLIEHVVRERTFPPLPAALEQRRLAHFSDAPRSGSARLLPVVASS